MRLLFFLLFYVLFCLFLFPWQDMTRLLCPKVLSQYSHYIWGSHAELRALPDIVMFSQAFSLATMWSTCGMHNDLSLSPAFRWMWFTSFDYSWYLVWSVTCAFTCFEVFFFFFFIVHQFFALLVWFSLWNKRCCHPMGFLDGIFLWHSDWLKLFRWMATWDPVCMVVAFCSLARILGEGLTIHSLPELFMLFKWISACTH